MITAHLHHRQKQARTRRIYGYRRSNLDRIHTRRSPQILRTLRIIAVRRLGKQRLGRMQQMKNSKVEIKNRLMVVMNATLTRLVGLLCGRICISLLGLFDGCLLNCLGVMTCICSVPRKSVFLSNFYILDICRIPYLPSFHAGHRHESKVRVCSIVVVTFPGVPSPCCLLAQNA